MSGLSVLSPSPTQMIGHNSDHAEKTVGVFGRASTFHAPDTVSTIEFPFLVLRVL
ncbi:hypothetical protein BDZ89DRAFT_1060956 [Hymenopellis radicata]|nr:hypothetical protein BDZ89DRAFT_1064806 [Hymenopellis radicata]KAF9039503.1 hypothetical protein BDZ89DRAFT_1060951 [Hymenopellis radicata]KAF9039507.1 hypothetical protein BDZ89DRAFT_1060956 [Hymenopellis radicata]